MVDLSDVSARYGIKIDDSGSTQIVIVVDQMANHLARLSNLQVFGDFINSLTFLEVGWPRGDPQSIIDFSCINLLPELNLENVIATQLEDGRQLGHGALDFLVEMVSTVHVARHQMLANDP